MFKWAIAAAGIVLLVLFIRWQRQTLKTAYVNGLAPYSSLPGKVYIFERNCYIFKLKGKATDFPLVGDHDVVPALPDNVSAANVGADLPGVRILDIARVGDRFEIASVRRDTGRTGTRITFEIFYLNDAERKFPRLDAYYIMDHRPEARGEAPTLLTQYAAPEVVE